MSFNRFNGYEKSQKVDFFFSLKKRKRKKKIEIIIKWQDLLKRTLTLTSFKACFKPRKMADKEEVDEERNFRPEARPLVFDTCSKIHLPNCLTFCIKQRQKKLYLDLGRRSITGQREYECVKIVNWWKP